MIKPHNKGFTLIETLFVIAILAVVSSLGIAVYQQRTSTAKVDQTTTELKLFSQAAVNYFNDTGAWPIPLNSETLKAYIPYGKVNSANEYQNPWGNVYKTTTTDSDANTYNITTTIPSENLAEQVEADLPFAKVTMIGNTAQLQIAIPGPGSTATASNYILTGQGTIKLNLVTQPTYSPAAFDCPTDYTPGMTAVLSGMMSDQGNAPGLATWGHSDSTAIYQAGVDTSCKLISKNHYQCQFNNLLYTKRKISNIYGNIVRLPMNQKDKYMSGDESTNEYSYLQYNYKTFCYKPYDPGKKSQTEKKSYKY